MGQRPSGAAEGSVRGMLTVLSCAVLLALTLLLAARTEAQESTVEQTAAQTKDVTTTATKVQETTAQVDETTTVTATKNENTVTQSRNTSSEEPEQSVQQGGQQSQATEGEDADTQTAARAANPLAKEPAEITETSDDDDATIANRIVVSGVDCTVSEGATVTVRDADGTQVRLTDNGNVNITQKQSRIVIVGTADENGNLDGVNASGEFGPSNDTETGRVVSSTGITCVRDDGGGDDDGNGEDGNGSDEGCDNPQVVRSFTGTENQRTSTFRIDGASFRLSYEVEVTDSNGFSVLEVDVLDNNGQAIGEGFITFKQDGSENILAGSGNFSLEIRADDVRYRVTVEDCGNVTSDGNNDDDGVIVNVPDDDLPDTGGVPISVLAGCAALLLVGTAMIGVVVRRRL